MGSDWVEQVKKFERAVLGAILLENDVMDRTAAELESTDFIDHRNQIVYLTMLNMFNEAKPMDLLSVTNEVRRSGYGEKAAPSYIAELTEGIPSSANVRYYIQEVKRDSRRRYLLDTTRSAGKELETGKDSEQVVEKMEDALLHVSSDRGHTMYLPAAAMLLTAHRKIEEIGEKGVDAMRATTGFPSVDRMLGGMDAEDYVVLGARPSVGKSAIGLQIAFHNAWKGKSVAYFTLEMSGESLMSRAMAQQAGINSKKLRTGMLSRNDHDKIVEFGEKVHDIKLFINDSPNMKMNALRRQARMVKQREGLDLIVVDYLTLISLNPRLPRWEEVSQISRNLKELARELEAPVMALSQLGRDSENHRPTLASLRESGSIEQDADVVFLLHRKAEPKIDTYGDPLPVEIEFILAKQRNGPVGTRSLIFKPELTKFAESSAQEG